MANTQAMCSSFKSEVMLGLHQLGSVTLTSRGSLTAPTTDTIKAALYLASATVNASTTAYSSTGEVTGTNYTAGGATLGTVTLTRSTGTVTFDAADVVWTQSASGFSTGRKFVVYRSTGVGTTSRLFSVVTADADVGNVTGDLTSQWSASGIATWTTT